MAHAAWRRDVAAWRSRPRGLRDVIRNAVELAHRAGRYGFGIRSVALIIALPLAT